MVVKALILPGIPLAVGILWKRLHRDKSGCKSNKKMSDLAAKLLKEIEAMDGRVGYDAIIVCCSTLQQVREKAVRIFTFQGIYIDLWNVEGFRRFRRSAFTGRIQMRSVALENFWQSRLQDTAGQAAVKGALILAVHEDWAPDGAGNGLGTLYAYTKARAKAEKQGVDLDKKIKEGSVPGSKGD
eukprot:131127-Prorocentrum_minimum.AAC.5